MRRELIENKVRDSTLWPFSLKGRLESCENPGSIMLRRVSRKPLRMPMRTKMCHCQTFCANGRLHDTFVNVNPQNTIATQFCDESFTTVKADHRVLQHIYKEHFLIRDFVRLGFQIINLQPWPTLATNFFCREHLQRSPLVWFLKAGGIVMHWPGKLSRGPSWAGPSRKLDQCIGISEASFEPATFLGGLTYYSLERKCTCLIIAEIFYQPFNWFNVDQDWKLCLGVVV